MLGDFSGRAGAGVLELGAALAKRKPHKVDVDNLDALLDRLCIRVAVPVDEDGQVLSIPIASMDDFHPDQLVENVPVLAGLAKLRRDLQSRAGFDRAAKEVLSWSGETALPPPATRRATGSAIATDRKLSDFARLTGRKPADEAETGALIRRLVGPFVVPDASRQDALVARVDAALSDALRRVLHHPNFQCAEALWRGLEFLVRRVETDATLQIVLYDISAEELSADVAASDALDKSGLYSLLVEQPALDAHQGPLSLIAGLYQFEATPPHAELLSRIAKLGAAAGAPFVAAVGSDLLNTPMHEWHPLTREAWTSLRGLPAAAYLGLTTPRFLLRMPYGRKTDPIDAFPFEEFTRQAGLSGSSPGPPGAPRRQPRRRDLASRQGDAARQHRHGGRPAGLYLPRCRRRSDRAALHGAAFHRAPGGAHRERRGQSGRRAARPAGGPPGRLQCRDQPDPGGALGTGRPHSGAVARPGSAAGCEARVGRRGCRSIAAREAGVVDAGCAARRRQAGCSRPASGAPAAPAAAAKAAVAAAASSPPAAKPASPTPAAPAAAATASPIAPASTPASPPAAPLRFRRRRSPSPPRPTISSCSPASTSRLRRGPPTRPSRTSTRFSRR